jgi:FkbM family methyltransferase
MLNRNKPFIHLLFFIFSSSIYGTGEPVPFALLQKILPENPIILEAGAQFGEDTTWMSQLWPRGTIYAFEPSPLSFLELEKVAYQANNIVAIPLALSDKKGSFSFYLAGGASSLLKPQDSFNTDYFHSDLNNPIIVDSITLNEWAHQNNVKNIDFMWLDMEGNELNALKGSLDLLPQVKLIYTEVNLQRFWHNCVMYEELTAWLEEQGFVEIWHYIVPHWHGNALFINTKV